VPTPATPVLSPHAAAVASYEDALRLKAVDLASGKHEAKFYRYLWIPEDEKHREEFVTVLYYHVHLLSDQGSYGTFTMLAPNLIRIDVREYGWDKRFDVWEKSANIDRFFHAKKVFLEDAYEVVRGPARFNPKLKKMMPGVLRRVRKQAGTKVADVAPTLPREEMDGLRKILETESPILNAEWFFVQTARQVSIRNTEDGFGYYDFLGIKDRNTFFKLVGVHEDEAVKRFRELREVVTRSGISKQNRQVLRLGAISGGVWGTLDTFDQSGKGVAKSTLKRGEFKHNAEEWYGPNPLELPITFLSDDKGVKQGTAPDKVGGDKSALNIGNDPRIHVNLCMRCHGVNKDHLQPIDGWARKRFAPGKAKLQDEDKATLLQLQSQYLRDLNESLDADRLKYSRAVAKVTRSKKHPLGMTVAEATKAYIGALNRYVEEEVTLAKAARELGVTPARFTQALRAYQAKKGRTENILADFLDDPPGSIPRLDWEDAYQFAATLCAGVAPAEILQRGK